MGHIAVIEHHTHPIRGVHMDDGSEPHLPREELGKELLSGNTGGEVRHDFQTKRPGEILQQCGTAEALGQPVKKIYQVEPAVGRGKKHSEDR